MNTNMQSQIESPRAVSGEGWAAVIGIIGSALLLAKKLLTPKAAKPEPMSRADFYAELVVLKDHIHAGHLAILEKLDANQREFLAAQERQATRINALEAGLARVDERTGYGSPKAEGRKKAETRIPNRATLAVRRHNEVPIRSLRFLLFSS